MTDKLRETVTKLFTSFAGQGNSLTIPRPYVDFCSGDILAALLLNQILYWADRSTDPDGWVAKSYNDWHKEIALTEYQVKRAINGDKRSKEGFAGLKTFGVETDLRRSDFYKGAATMHYRVNRVALMDAVMHYVSGDTPQQCKVVPPNNVQNDDLNNVDPLPPTLLGTLPITTTETTTETTTAEEAPPRKNIYGLLEDLTGATLNPILVDDLKDAEKEYPADWITDAFKEAAVSNGRNWKYVLAILKRWRSEGKGSNGKPQPAVVSSSHTPAKSAAYSDGVPVSSTKPIPASELLKQKGQTTS